MTDFKPHQPEEMIKIEVSTREAQMIMILRKYQYGKFLIHKMNGKPSRIEATDSVLIDGKDYKTI